MRHATDETLDRIEPLLAELRKIEGLRERKRGVFLHRSRAFLHFHDDPEGVFADLRGDTDFERFAVGTASQRRTFLAQVRTRVER